MAPAAPRRCVFMLPGDWQQATGGTRYDRRITDELRALGWQVDGLLLAGAYPLPSDAERMAADAAHAALPDDSLVVADGLAFGALPDLAARHAARLCWIALVHHPLALETGLDAAMRAALFDSERRALAQAHGVIVTSAATARELADHGVAPARLRVVEPGIDAAPRARGSGGPGLALLCVATLTPRKGHLALIDALATVQDRAWTLHCAGSATRDPATAATVRAAIARHGLQARVMLHGEVDEARLAALYDASDAFVLASRYEGYGMVLAEALARGLPIIASGGGAVADTVPTEAGLCVPVDDPAALRDALARLLDDAPWRASLAAGAVRARARLCDWPAAGAAFASALTALAALQRPDVRDERA